MVDNIDEHAQAMSDLAAAAARERYERACNNLGVPPVRFLGPPTATQRAAEEAAMAIATTQAAANAQHNLPVARRFARDAQQAANRAMAHANTALANNEAGANVAVANAAAAQNAAATIESYDVVDNDEFERLFPLPTAISGTSTISVSSGSGIGMTTIGRKGMFFARADVHAGRLEDAQGTTESQAGGALHSVHGHAAHLPNGVPQDGPTPCHQTANAHLKPPFSRKGSGFYLICMNEFESPSQFLLMFTASVEETRRWLETVPQNGHQPVPSCRPHTAAF